LGDYNRELLMTERVFIAGLQIASVLQDFVLREALRDIVCKGLAQDNFDANRATACDVMTPGIHCCRDDDDLAKAVQHMEKLKVRRLPVINKSKRMVGILSLGDISHSAPGAVLTEWAKSVSAHH
jgi:CBS domain-containing protein